ncbi:MAG: hypothetical protein OEW08_05515 [Gammaproteobacteria bacterium]|nr:hypothetical protein [Gammaproteobacteria bacterium]
MGAGVGSENAAKMCEYLQDIQRMALAVVSTFWCSRGEFELPA